MLTSKRANTTPTYLLFGMAIETTKSLFVPVIGTKAGNTAQREA